MYLSNYQRKLFKILKNISTTKQLFIATHSCVFVDTDNLENVWMVNYENNETEIKRVARARAFTYSWKPLC